MSVPFPQGWRPGEILLGRGAKVLEEGVPEVPPPHPIKDGAVPGAAGEGMGRCGFPLPLRAQAWGRDRGAIEGQNPLPSPA